MMATFIITSLVIVLFIIYHNSLTLSFPLLHGLNRHHHHQIHLHPHHRSRAFAWCLKSPCSFWEIWPLPLLYKTPKLFEGQVTFAVSQPHYSYGQVKEERRNLVLDLPCFLSFKNLRWVGLILGLFLQNYAPRFWSQILDCLLTFDDDWLDCCCRYSYVMILGIVVMFWTWLLT